LPRTRTQCREIEDATDLPRNLLRVKQAAERDRKTKFTALLHHVDVVALKRAFHRVKRDAAPGVDGETVASYEPELDAKLEALCKRVQDGRYRPSPIRRVHIPKSDGGKRPLGILVLEDKIVQGAVAELLGAIYEVDFVDNSYGFRPGRSCHDALDAVRKGVMRKQTNFVLDADIKSFFDSVDHRLMLMVLAVRIADKRILRLIEQWLKVGVLESGKCVPSEVGTPQGATISPLLANIFLHYALDKWVLQYRTEPLFGKMFFVRYADDFVMGFQYRFDAEKMLADLHMRMAKCGLRLHGDKTRLIEFGQWAARNRAWRGVGKPETFDFLGFTHYCSRARGGYFMVKVKTQSKRVSRKLKELRIEAKRRMHEPVGSQHRWLCQVLRGHYAYYDRPGNSQALNTFLWQVQRLWFKALQRRGSRRRMNWARYNELLEHFPLPRPSDTRRLREQEAA
jgi:group II intron reverse transcriptase/maturase